MKDSDLASGWNTLGRPGYVGRKRNQAIAAGRSIDTLVPPAVAEYIARHGLYA